MLSSILLICIKNNIYNKKVNPYFRITDITDTKVGFPDYSRRVNLSIAANTDYIIPYDCEFSCYTSGSPSLVVYTNGQLWSNIDTSSGIISTTKGTVKKGVVVRLSNSTASNVVVWICPLI